MPKNIVDQTSPEAVNESRRNLLITGAAAAIGTAISGTATLAQEVLAAEVIPASVENDEVQWEYLPSAYGLDAEYHSVQYPMGALLSQGEAEFIQSATPVFEGETQEAWNDLWPRIAAGEISNFDAQDLREFTPQMLRTFTVALDPEDPVYGGLWSTGGAYVSSLLAGSST